MSTKIFGDVVPSRIYIPFGTADWALHRAGDSGTPTLRKGAYSNLILMSFSTNDQELVDIRRCFGDLTHIFSFGRNPQAATMTMHFKLFIAYKCISGNKAVDRDGDDGADIGEAVALDAASGQLTMDQLREWYEASRLYSSVQDHSGLEHFDINVDTLNVQGYLVNMSLGQVDPATHSCNVTLTFILRETA